MKFCVRHFMLYSYLAVVVCMLFSPGHEADDGYFDTSTRGNVVHFVYTVQIYPMMSKTVSPPKWLSVLHMFILSACLFCPVHDYFCPFVCAPAVHVHECSVVCGLSLSDWQMDFAATCVHVCTMPFPD